MRIAMSTIIIVVMLMLIGSPLISQQEYEKITEEVSVDWWQVPLFAVDKEGNPVMDLQLEDIEVVMEGNVMPAFTLDKRTFTVTAGSAGAAPAPTAETRKQDLLKKKVIVLLFDQAVSGASSIRRAKNVAAKIINEAEENTRFYVLSIDDFAGLIYIGEGSGNNKDSLLQLIAKKINEQKKERHAGPVKAGESGKRNKYEADEASIVMQKVYAYYNRKSMGFFNSFESLYFFLNSIKDHKFVYLFSEGITRSTCEQDGIVKYFLKRVANYLSRSGAVLFAINTMGVLTSYTSLHSGEDALDFLVKESGGTYLEGTAENIVRYLTNMHHAYYEVSFPDLPGYKGRTRKIDIYAKRKGITIHTLRSLEETKTYSDMKPLEKNVLVLNLVSMPDDTLIKGKIRAYNARLEKTQKSKKNIAYTVSLPPGCLYKHIDLYKIWLTADDQGVNQVEKIEAEVLYPKKDTLKIEFALGKDKKQNKTGKEDNRKETAATRAYFVLIDKDANPARAMVYGSGDFQEDPEWEELAKSKIANRPKRGKTLSPGEMKRILQGAAEYCERIKESAFHFYCQENIRETQSPLSKMRRESHDKDITSMNVGTTSYGGLDFARAKSYTFGYRLIKQGTSIKEERDYISSSEETEADSSQVITLNLFFSQRAVFAPNTILESSRQENYHYEFVDFAQYQGRPVVIIEAVPKEPGRSEGVYGKIWIDTEDFSVMKIDADPLSIHGYDRLKELADKLHTKLYLSLETEFNTIYNGIRFPTQVKILEKYKGGSVINNFRGSKGWERTRTEFTYSDYKFFDVTTEVTER